MIPGMEWSLMTWKLPQIHQWGVKILLWVSATHWVSQTTKVWHTHISGVSVKKTWSQLFGTKGTTDAKHNYK